MTAGRLALAVALFLTAACTAESDEDGFAPSPEAVAECKEDVASWPTADEMVAIVDSEWCSDERAAWVAFVEANPGVSDFETFDAYGNCLWQFAPEAATPGAVSRCHHQMCGDLSALVLECWMSACSAGEVCDATAVFPADCEGYDELDARRNHWSESCEDAPLQHT